jgi:hypothetical protein
MNDPCIELRKDESMKHLSQTALVLSVVACVAIAIAAGCASVPLRTEASTSGIRAAEEVGAERVPRAALHLQLAREELGQARELAARGEEERALSLLSRAEVDAEFAVALSREDAERARTVAEVDSVRQLRHNN